MSDPVLDGLARTLAQPMPRRRAVRVMAAGFLAAAVPALRPGRSAAGGCGDCPDGQEDCGCGDCCDGQCVGPNFECCAGDRVCGNSCCPPDEVCSGGRCVEKCSPKRTRCGDKCCPAGERCVKGKCRQCPEDRKACGKKCCGKGEDCCFDETRKICCDTRRRECCPVGEPDNEEITCCPERTRCTPQIVQGQAGLTEDSPTVCCPPRRHVPLGRGRGACCPPGYTSMGGKLVVTACPGDPTQGLCCQDALTCGSGKDITCCCPGQSCANGACV